MVGRNVVSDGGPQDLDRLIPACYSIRKIHIRLTTREISKGWAKWSPGAEKPT
ncbi:MAG: hypothetical protein NZ602_05390 [Thermoguttaceae bacterium]|nr:hypothetical protein [Thermoguttaceae bacterium]MDW8036454.1 hypothetical protein [Thermoguttaceae bacterium]